MWGLNVEAGVGSWAGQGRAIRENLDNSHTTAIKKIKTSKKVKLFLFARIS